ncbi:PucR family transcriptional regulator [Arthrobacter methylotrophus]|uniref:PucR family transcriptional regulator n=1 Tax=Arthrobacter methylotrophus TaxID=121291 RepID=A0ABV5UMG2_9MICC
MSGDPGESLRSLIRAARSGGLQGVIAGLHRALGADTALFDLNGNTLAAAPARTLWDYAQVLEASKPSSLPVGVAASRVYVDNEPVAILAANTGNDPQRLVDAGVDLVTLEIGRLRARQEGKRELTQHFIDDLIHGRVSEGEGNSRLRGIGFDPRQQYRVLLGQSQTRRERLLSVPWNIHTLLSNQSEPFVRVVVEGRIFMLVPSDPMVDHIAKSLLHHMSEIGSMASVGVSSTHVGAAGIRAGYFEALAAAEAGPGLQHPGAVDLGHLLILTNTQVPVRDIAASTLKPLLDYDTSHGSELVRTLRIFLTADRSFASTAEELFIHRNTLRYRLRQIKELLGHEITATRQISNLWLVLKALEEVPGD